MSCFNKVIILDYNSGFKDCLRKHKFIEVLLR